MKYILQYIPLDKSAGPSIMIAYTANEIPVIPRKAEFVHIVFDLQSNDKPAISYEGYVSNVEHEIEISRGENVTRIKIFLDNEKSAVRNFSL